MKQIAFAVLLILAVTSVYSQSATLATPEQPPSRTHLIVGSVCIYRDVNDAAYATVELWVMGSDGSKRDVITVQMLGPEVIALITAQATAIGGEAGGPARRLNARILNFLKLNCATFATPCEAKIGLVTVIP